MYSRLKTWMKVWLAKTLANSPEAKQSVTRYMLNPIRLFMVFWVCKKSAKFISSCPIELKIALTSMLTKKEIPIKLKII